MALDAEDKRIVAFYCDYLVDSGVLPGNRGNLDLTALGVGDLDRLLERHALTRERLTGRFALYRRDGARWSAVLEEVRRCVALMEGGK